MGQTVNSWNLPTASDLLDTNKKEEWQELEAFLAKAGLAINTDGTVNTVGDLTLDGDIDGTGQAVDFDLIDNNASALSFDATDKAGILAIDTTDSSEKVTMSGGLDVTGAVDVTGALSVASITTDANIGEAGSGVTAVEYGDGRIHQTVLTVSSNLGSIAGGAALGLGHLVYTLPAGAIVVESAYMSMALDEDDGHITNDTPDIGIGTTVASGENATLQAVGAAAENILTGQTANDCNGTAEVKTVADQVLVIEAGGDHTVYFNVADTWAASGENDCAIAGTIVLNWRFMA